MRWAPVPKKARRPRAVGGDRIVCAACNFTLPRQGAPRRGISSCEPRKIARVPCFPLHSAHSQNNLFIENLGGCIWVLTTADIAWSSRGREHEQVQAALSEHSPTSHLHGRRRDITACGGGYGGGSSMPPATVTVSVKPTSITLGQSATVTWSTNGSMCTASGAWSGTKGASGTESVTPAAVGTYTYTLVCSGGAYGGSTSQSATLTVTAAMAAVVAQMKAAMTGSANFTADADDILIADQFNNRVLEIQRSTHKVVWQFGDGSDKPGPHSIVGVNDAERFGPFTLLSGTGTPASNPPLPGCSDPINGCPDNRVFIVDESGEIIWQYGQAGVAGADFDQLNTPVHALFMSGFPQQPRDFYIMITDQGNQRTIVVNLEHEIVWQYGLTGVAGMGPNQLSNPNSAELLENGHILIADESNNRVIEVSTDHQIVKTFTAAGTVNGAAFASRLPNGNTLITDSNNNRAVEVSSQRRRGLAIRDQHSVGQQPESLADPRDSPRQRRHADQRSVQQSRNRSHARQADRLSTRETERSGKRLQSAQWSVRCEGDRRFHGSHAAV